MREMSLDVQRVTFIMKGSKESVGRLVRRMLDDAELEHVAFTIQAGTEEDLLNEELRKRLREGTRT